MSSEAPTTAPSLAALALSSSVASPFLALSLASPAPAAVTSPAAAGTPTPGIAAVPRIPAKDPRASPNFLGTSVDISPTLASGAR